MYENLWLIPLGFAAGVLGSIVGKAMETKDTAEESGILISVGRL